MGSIDDISQLCRLCLVKDQVNIPIFDETSDIAQTFVKINSCLPVKVSRDDNLPKKICDGCSYKLDMLYSFRSTSIDSEKQLISWLNQAGLSTISQTAIKDPLGNAKPEIMVKQETFDTTDARGDEGDGADMGVEDAQTYLMQQQQLSYEQEFEFAEASGPVPELTDEPPPKRAKRAATLKKAPIDDETEEAEDDLDAAMQITKAEEEDSDDVDQPDYVEAPSTSADDQPGPSGVGKTTVEAPSEKSCAKNTCKLCNIKFENYKLLKKHRFDVHTPERYQCTTCGRKFKERYRLKLHSTVHSDEKPHVCDICEERFRTSQQMFHHKKRHVCPPQGHVCPECGRKFLSNSAYQEHLGSHRGVRYTCLICQQAFRSRFILKCHKKTHAPNYQEPRVKCNECNKVFKSENSLKKHVSKLHEGERHLCEVCGKALMSAASLRDHTFIHTGEKPFSCSHCDKKFARKQHLSDHERVHTKEKPHACSFCDKKYSQRTPLTLHIRRVHKGERRFGCIACGKQFASNAELKNHIRSHPSKNTF